LPGDSHWVLELLTVVHVGAAKAAGATAMDAAAVAANNADAMNPRLRVMLNSFN